MDVELLVCEVAWDELMSREVAVSQPRVARSRSYIGWDHGS